MKASRLAAAVSVVFAGWLGAPVGAAEKAPPAPPKVVPVTDDDEKKLLDAETAEQKQLRGELAQLAKTGQKIYFNANCDGVQRVYSMDPDGSEMKCITPAPGPGGEHPQVSPDGSKVVYGAPVKKEDAARFPPANAGENQRLESTGQGVFVLDLNKERAAPEPVAIGSEPRWSPDMRRLTYLYKFQGRGRRVAIYDIEKKKEHPVIVPGVQPGCYPAFTPDGGALFICGRGGALLELDAERLEPAKPIKSLTRAFGQGCNLEFSRDGKLITWVVDTYGDKGGWLYYAPFDPGKKVTPVKLPLGWKAESVNYFPDFSPCGKYYIYAHAEQQKGVDSWLLLGNQDLYVTRFPDCKATVRLTWTNAACQHPQWWGPPGAK
jgi:Tol biopolymer transport system component